MKEYRKRFVQMSMLLVGIVLFVMMGIIAIYMYRDYYDSLQATMEQIVEPLDSFTESMECAGQQEGAQQRELAEPATHDPQPPEEPTDEQAPADHPARRDDGRRQGIMTVFYEQDSDNVTVLSQESLYDGNVLANILEAVTGQEDSYGTLVEYQVIYYCTGSSNLYKIALASTSYILVPMLRLVLVLLLIWILAMVCLLLVSIRMARIAVRPMEQAMERERQFVADASHDLKTPLSVILANNSILRENPDAPVSSLMRWIDSTQSAAGNMQQMIGDMLTLADAEREDVSLAMGPVDAAEIVTKAVLQLESIAYEKGVCLETDLPEELFLQTNADYLQRIVTSLIENAIKYEPTGGTILVRLAQIDHHIHLMVTNQHATIDPADLPHIFERFYRADKSRGNGTGGHGLGLAITRQMVERLGGEIKAASSENTGTTFTVSL